MKNRLSKVRTSFISKICIESEGVRKFLDNLEKSRAIQSQIPLCKIKIFTCLRSQPSDFMVLCCTRAGINFSESIFGAILIRADINS